MIRSIIFYYWHASYKSNWSLQYAKQPSDCKYFNRRNQFVTFYVIHLPNGEDLISFHIKWMILKTILIIHLVRKHLGVNINLLTIFVVEMKYVHATSYNIQTIRVEDTAQVHNDFLGDKQLWRVWLIKRIDLYELLSLKLTRGMANRSNGELYPVELQTHKNGNGEKNQPYQSFRSRRKWYPYSTELGRMLSF